MGGFLGVFFVSHNLSFILSNIFVIFLLVENENSDSSNRSSIHKIHLVSFLHIIIIIIEVEN